MNAVDRYDSLFQYYGLKAGVSWFLLKAQAQAESRLDPDAQSKAGAQGIAQFMPATFVDLVQKQGWLRPGALVDPRDPEDAIAAQALYLGWLLKECKDTRLALAAYNWGIGNVTRVFLRPGLPYNPSLVPQETRDYIAKIQEAVYGR